MTASKTTSLANISKVTIQHYLALIQVAFMITIWVFWSQINKIFKQQEDTVKASSINSVMNGVVANNPQNLCITASNVEDFKKLQLYTLIILIFVNVSPLLNSLYLAFQYKLPSDRWIVTLPYGLLAASGIVGMALSVDGFMKISSTTNQPADCVNLSQKLKIFFILSISINVFQTAVSLWTLKELYYVAKKF